MVDYVVLPEQSRQVSVEGRKRQCGICAACMLRRLSVHGAGLSEPSSVYVWEDLGASTFECGVASSFEKGKITPALRQYAIAGTLHLDHLAGLQQSPANVRAMDLSGFQLSRALGISETDAREKLGRLLSQHRKEWKNFMQSLGKTSFVAEWAIHGRS